MKRVAVIGAGAAGLVAIRHLVSSPQLYHCVAYEVKGQVGGTWCYKENLDKDEQKEPIVGAMYQNLITNLPKEIMAYPDHPFDENLPSFVGHRDVRDYLESYGTLYDLHKYIKFNHLVEKIWRSDDKPNTWLVQSTCKDRNPTSQCVEQFDAIFICNGHYTAPLWPVIDGAADFLGTIDHSRNYRTPDNYRDKVVVLLGAKPSGQDISLDIANVAKKVLLSHSGDPLPTQLPHNLQQRSAIKRFTKTGVIFQDGQTEAQVDHVIFCTGYLYSFPFLDSSCDVTIDNGRITPLYKHLVNVNHDSMFFIGICSVIVPFPQFDLQVRYALSWLSNSFEKPDTLEMLDWIEQDYRERIRAGLKHKYAHMLGDTQWEYAESLAHEGKISPLNPVIRKIYDSCKIDRESNVMTYRTVNFVIVNNVDYEKC